MFQKIKMKMLPASNEGREAGLNEGKATSQEGKMKLRNLGIPAIATPVKMLMQNHRTKFILFSISSTCSKISIVVP